MQPVYLKPGVHLAKLGADLISLDVGAGQYGCLPGMGAALGGIASDGRLEVGSGDVTDALLEAGLAGGDRRDPEQSRAAPLRKTSAWRTGRVVTTAADRKRLLLAYLSAAPRFWRASFRELVAVARRDRPVAAEAWGPATTRDAQAFDQLLPFAPFQGECLFRSFLLLAFLRRAGRDAAWVFGVRTYPFEAHCWLQAGDVVLDDAVERTLAYTPIFAV